MFRKQKIKPYDRQQVLSILPFELKAKILRHLYTGAIHSVPLLKQMADDDMFLTDMCLRLQPYNCSEKTFVYQRGELAEACKSFWQSAAVSCQSESSWQLMDV